MALRCVFQRSWCKLNTLPELNLWIHKRCSGVKGPLKKESITSVIKEIRWCRLRYFGHLQRMDRNVWPRRVNYYVVPRILPRGRPQLRWSDVITKELKDLNIRNKLSDERVEWRKAIMPRKIQLQSMWPIRRGHVL